MDLINSILQEKEHRLCSQKYKYNDYRHSKLAPGHLIAKPANRHSRDYQGYYVYPDDAADIKAHPFFRGLAWDRLHLSKPPFIPDVKSQDDTKYFDDEDPISDVDDASSCSSVHDGLGARFQPKIIEPTRVTQLDGTEGPLNYGPILPPRDITIAIGGGADGKRMKKVRAKKRPRDRVLRDKEVGRKVLELRKKGAFLGYTYRRPSVMSDEEERGRQLDRQAGS